MLSDKTRGFQVEVELGLQGHVEAHEAAVSTLTSLICFFMYRGDSTTVRASWGFVKIKCNNVSKVHSTSLGRSSTVSHYCHL